MVFIAYINLARRTDRRARMEDQLNRLEFVAQRIEAITPDGIEPALAERHTSLRNIEHVRITELSCTLSHHAALKAFLDSGDEHGLILEDDVVLSSSIKTLIECPLHGFDILRLETYLDPQHHFKSGTSTIGAFSLHRIASRCAGAAAYIVSKHAARTILEDESAKSRPYDFVLFFPFRRPGARLKAMQIIPALAMQEDRLVQKAYEGDVQRPDDRRLPKPPHLAIPHGLISFWLSDAQINIVKSFNRLIGRTRREIVPASLE